MQYPIAVLEQNLRGRRVEQRLQHFVGLAEESGHRADLVRKWPEQLGEKHPVDIHGGQAVSNQPAAASLRLRLELCGETGQLGLQDVQRGGDRLVHGGKGEVVGPSTDEPDERLAVRFPDNKDDIGCDVTMLSRTRYTAPTIDSKTVTKIKRKTYDKKPVLQFVRQ